MYKCEDCGHLFEEGEQASWNEDRGEFWGVPCVESVSGCPMCKGNYEEVKPCKICGSYDHHYQDEYCEKCKKDVRDRFQTFLNSNFTPEERVLLNELYDGEYL